MKHESINPIGIHTQPQNYQNNPPLSIMENVNQNESNDTYINIFRNWGK